MAQLNLVWGRFCGEVKDIFLGDRFCGKNDTGFRAASAAKVTRNKWGFVLKKKSKVDAYVSEAR